MGFPSEIEHVFFDDVFLRQAADPAVVHIDMASGTRAGTAAVSLDTRHIVVPGPLHQRRSRWDVHFMWGAVGLYEGDFCHATLLHQ